MPQILSQDLILRCCNDPFAEEDQNKRAHANGKSPFIELLELLYVNFVSGRKSQSNTDLSKLSYVTVVDLSMVRACNRRAQWALRLSPLWLYGLKHTLANPQDLPPTFSFFMLSSYLFAARNDKIFRRQILQGFREMDLVSTNLPQRKKKIAWTTLVAQPSTESSVAYWFKMLKEMLAFVKGIFIFYVVITDKFSCFNSPILKIFRQ